MSPCIDHRDRHPHAEALGLASRLYDDGERILCADLRTHPVLLSFTFSFDDFIIALFVAGPDNTLPLFVFSSIRRGVSPKINAIASVMLGVTLTLLFAAQIVLRRTGRATRPAPEAAGATEAELPLAG